MSSTKYNLSSIFKYDCISPNFTRKVMNQKMKRVNRMSLLESQHVEILKPDYLFIISLFGKRRVWRQYDDSVHGNFWGETSYFHEPTDPMPGGTQEVEVIQAVQSIPKKSNYNRQSFIWNTLWNYFHFAFIFILAFQWIMTPTLSMGHWHRPRGMLCRKHRQEKEGLKVPLKILEMSLPM